MARDIAIMVYMRMRQKYGGDIGIMKACVNGTLDLDDCEQYIQAKNALGI